jgi:hypothetical protein
MKKVPFGCSHKQYWTNVSVISFKCTIQEVLVQWKDTPPEDATWELATILQQFPHLNP